jgi:hypothetical protein
MISAQPHNYYKLADQPVDSSLGNVLFVIAGIIGIANKKRYSFAFPEWPNNRFFKYRLPVVRDTRKLKSFCIPKNYKGFDIGFMGFDYIPDNAMIDGYLGSEKYFEHCKPSIRTLLTMKDLCRPLDDCIIMHYRDYSKYPEFFNLKKDYYMKALKKFPDKKVVVITDNIEKAKKEFREDFEYVSNSPIVDFYLLTKAKYLIMANSTFSWWGAWLSQAQTVAPLNWYAESWSDCPKKDLYCKEWEII